MKAFYQSVLPQLSKILSSHYGPEHKKNTEKKLPSNHSIFHEQGSEQKEWAKQASKRMSERCEQGRASKWVSSAKKWAIGWASGPVLYSGP